MMEKTCRIGDVAAIGYTPENEARRLRFSIAKHAAYWPDATPEMLVVRPGEDAPYIAKTETEGKELVWTVTRYDTEKPGTGAMWIAFKGADGKQLGLTPMTMIHIASGPPGVEGEEPPDGAIPWVEDVLDAAERAEDAARRAQEIAEALAGGGDGSIDSGLFLPAVSEADDGKVLTVVSGKWAAAELPKYDGAYEVKPLTDGATTLKTAQKFMDGDVIVSKIPYFETSNTDGGETAYIGTEVDIYGD